MQTFFSIWKWSVIWLVWTYVKFIRIPFYSFWTAFATYIPKHDKNCVTLYSPGTPGSRNIPLPAEFGDGNNTAVTYEEHSMVDAMLLMMSQKSARIVCSHGTVFRSNRLELSPSLEYNSRDLSISPMLKLLYLTSFSEVFTLYSSLFSLKIQITEWFK